MTEVIGVRFKQVGKIYYFSPNGVQMPVGEKVIVETARGIECGEVALSNREIEDEGIVKPLKTVIRVANKEDLKRIEDNKAKEKKAFRLCLEKIEKHKLEMKLVDVEYTFDNNKILFYFTADGRVDFRELVKDLASVFKTRIELRQIGVRDEAKMLGGLGICGRPFCCCSFLGEFQPVSIKMAKEQGLSFVFHPAELREAHPNTAVLTVEGASGKKTKVQAASIGGGRIRVDQLDGVAVDFTGIFNTLIVRHMDVPGELATLTKVLSDGGINIANMSLVRDRRGGSVMTIFEIDQPVPEAVREKLAQVPCVVSVIYYEKEDD